MTQAIIMIDADSGRKDKREVKSQSQVIEEENKDEHACTELVMIFCINPCLSHKVIHSSKIPTKNETVRLLA